MLGFGIVLTFDAVPDQSFHVDADLDPDWHQNDAEPLADPTASFTHVGKCEFFKGFFSLLIGRFSISRSGTLANSDSWQSLFCSSGCYL